MIKGHGSIFGIPTEEVLRKLRHLILDAAQEALPGPRKMDRVVRDACKWIAEKTPIPDWLEIPVYSLAIRAVLQVVYSELKSDGQV